MPESGRRGRLYDDRGYHRNPGKDGRIDAFITCAFMLKQFRPAEPKDFDGPRDYLPSSIRSEHGFLMARPFSHDVNHAIDMPGNSAGCDLAPRPRPTYAG